MERTELPVRLAIRHEGKSINAYIASADTMEGAILLGSLNKDLAQHEDFFEQWKFFMISAMSYMVETAFGEKPHMIERKPSEPRGGNA